ncbi:MAG: peptide MFS transporter [Pseudomonadota bacterium]
MFLEDQKSIPALFLLLFAEMWERFSYYGMRALLILYLTSTLGFSDPRAYATYALFAAIGYGIPPLAGILSDRYLGFQKMIIIGAIIMCLGHLLMSLTGLNGSFVYSGLGLIAVGTGFFKGNVTNLLGCLYENEAVDSAAKDKGFSMFYIAVNVGMGLASITCGYVAHKYGWHYGFGLAGVGMLAGLLTFMKFRYVLGDHGAYPNIKIEKNSKKRSFITTIASIIFLAAFSIYVLYYSEFFASYFGYFGIIIFTMLARAVYNCDPIERSRIALLMILVLFLVCFFAFEMQLGALINLFTERNIDRVVFGYEIPTAILQSINPITIITIGPLIIAALAFSSKSTPLPRFAMGLFLNVMCFVVLYLGCIYAKNGKAHILFLLFGIMLMSVVELFIVPLLQSLFVTLSPLRYRGFMMGIYMFGWSYSNLASVILSKFMSIPQESLSDPLASMVIYKKGFFHILEFNMGLFLVFMFCYPFLNKLVKKHY